MIPTGFSLDDKYLLDEGTVILSGIQALVRLPFDQHRADTALSKIITLYEPDEKEWLNYEQRKYSFISMSCMRFRTDERRVG